jgi:hypothetical protein
MGTRFGTMLGSSPSWVFAKKSSSSAGETTAPAVASSDVDEPAQKNDPAAEDEVATPVKENPKADLAEPAGDDDDDDDDAVELSPDAQLAAAKARYDEAKQRLNDAAAAFARAESEYSKAQTSTGGKNKSKKKSKKNKKKKKRSRRER